MRTPPSVSEPPPSAPPAAISPAAAPAAVGAAGPRVVFAAGAADLPDGARRELDALAQRMSASPQLRVQLVAYAAGAADEASQARRVSLSRALAVRSYLIEHGVAHTRMDVRALGNRAGAGEPADRVDIVVLDH